MRSNLVGRMIPRRKPGARMQQTLLSEDTSCGIHHGATSLPRGHPARSHNSLLHHVPSTTHPGPAPSGMVAEGKTSSCRVLPCRTGCQRRQVCALHGVCCRKHRWWRLSAKLRFACRPPVLLRKTGGGDRARTDDPLLAKQVLSQLSYTPVQGSGARDQGPGNAPS